MTRKRYENAKRKIRHCKMGNKEQIGIMKNFALFAGLSFVVLQANGSTLDIGKIAQYKFNGQGIDSYGSNNLVLNSGVNFVTDRFGDTNKAIVFNSSTGQASSLNSIGIYGNQSRSISMWVKADSLNSDLLGWGEINDPPSGEGFLIHMTPENGHQISVWGSFADIHSPNLGVSFFNAWKQLIYVYDGSVSNASIYVNGSLIGTSQAGAMINTDVFNTANTILRIGDRGDGRGLAGIGTAIDDISIYNRALNTSEAQQLYQIESVPEPSALSLLAVGLGGLAMMRRRRS
jgi:hypothetical protein